MICGGIAKVSFLCYTLFLLPPQERNAMKTDFNVDSILNFIYEMTSSRIKIKVEKSKLKHSEIYKHDPKLISRIINNKRTRNNPYLLNNSVIESSYVDDESNKNIPTGLLNTLDFSSKKDLLWGTDTEIENYLEEFFFILCDNEFANTQLGFEKYLCDYIPYAFCHTYWDILFHSDTTDPKFSCVEYKGKMLNYPAFAFGVSEDAVRENIVPSKEEAIYFLYDKCKDDFRSDFNKFTNETEDYSKLGNKIRNYIVDFFIPMLERYKPNESSLGLRVRNLIIEDLSYVACIYFKKNICNEDYHRALIIASSQYTKEITSTQIYFHVKQYPDSYI